MEHHFYCYRHRGLAIFGLVWLLLLVFILPTVVVSRPDNKASCKVVFAVNCGGPSYYSDENGITYKADTGFSGGISSDAGKSFSPFPHVSDDFVYQSERYGETSFSYMIPVNQNGSYVLRLRFSEVYFQQPNQKVFDIIVAGRLLVPRLDIFSLVGIGVPHDEFVSIERKGDQLFVESQPAREGGGWWDYRRGEMKVEFSKIENFDNPKINAIELCQGTKSDVPRLEPLKKKIEKNLRWFQRPKEY